MKKPLLSLLFTLPSRKDTETVNRVLMAAAFGPAALAFAIRLIPTSDAGIEVFLTVLALVALFISGAIRLLLLLAAIQGRGEELGYDKDREYASAGLFIPGLVRVYHYRIAYVTSSCLLLIGYTALLASIIAVMVTI